MYAYTYDYTIVRDISVKYSWRPPYVNKKISVGLALEWLVKSISCQSSL